MYDTATIGAAITSVRAIFDLLKNANDAQLAMRISSEVAQVQSSLLEVQQQALSLQTENQNLRNEVARFKTYTHHHSVGWRVRSDGTEDGPFCPTCIAEGRDMRLILRDHVDQTKEFFYVHCPRSHFGKSEVRDLGRGKEPSFAVPKHLVANDYFFVKAPISS